MPTDADFADRLNRAAQQINEPRTVEEVLHTVVQVARSSLTGIDHAGVTLAHRDGRLETAAATDGFVLELDRLQYEVGEGPCLSAVHEPEPIVVEHARHEARWHAFIPQAVRLGLRAMLGVRIFTVQGTTGVLNLYSTVSDLVDDDARHLAELFAVQAALAYGHVRELTNLQTAMSTRQTIGQAVGIVMERYGLDADRAFEHLVRLAANQETKLRDLATALVDETTRQALARGPRPGPAPA